MEPDMVVLALRYTYWAKGKSIEEALKGLQSLKGSKKKEKTIFYVCNDPSVYVDDMGCICYKGDCWNKRIGAMIV